MEQSYACEPVAMSDEVFEAVSRAGERVQVRFAPDRRDLVIEVGPHVVRPAWGSQACDDWLDWMDSQRRGGPLPLPVDEPDWLQDEGYHR
jgi:hypothetical protein